MLTTYLGHSDILHNAPFRSQIFKIFFASGGKGALTPLTKVPHGHSWAGGYADTCVARFAGEAAQTETAIVEYSVDASTAVLTRSRRALVWITCTQSPASSYLGSSHDATRNRSRYLLSDICCTRPSSAATQPLVTAASSGHTRHERQTDGRSTVAQTLHLRRLFVLSHRCCSSAATSRRHCMFQSSYASP